MMSTSLLWTGMALMPPYHRLEPISKRPHHQLLSFYYRHPSLWSHECDGQCYSRTSFSQSVATPLAKPLDLIWLYTRFSDFHETLSSKVYDKCGIRLPDTFFTFRFKDSRGQTHDIPLDTNLYRMQDLALQDGTVPNIQETIRPFLLSLVLPHHIFRVSPHTVHPNRKLLLSCWIPSSWWSLML